MTMPTEENLPEQDATLLQWVLRTLRSDPEASYKDVRKEARSAVGLTLSRRIWTSARRELGLSTVDEGEGDESGAPPLAPGRPMDDQGFQPRRPYEQDFRRPPRHEPPPWSRPDRPERPAPNFDAAADADRRRAPAWMQPSRSPWERPPEPVVEPAPIDQQKNIIQQARSAIEFMVEYLRSVNREAAFAEVQDAASRAGFSVYPTTFGRAQAILGIVEAPKPVITAPVVEAPKMPPLAPPTNPTPTKGKDVLVVSDAIQGINTFFKTLDRMEKDRSKMRDMTRQMLDTVRNALYPAPPAPTE